MYTYTVLRRPLFFEGNEILRIKISLPECDLPKEISEFYSTLSNNFIKWCEEEKFSALCTEYKSASKEKYIYRKKPYHLSVELLYRSETLVSTLVRASCGDKADALAEYHCWDATSGALLPPKYALAAIGKEIEKISLPRYDKTVLSVGTNGREVLFFRVS